MALNRYPARPPRPEETIAMTGRTVISTDRAPSLDAPLSQGLRRARSSWCWASSLTPPVPALSSAPPSQSNGPPSTQDALHRMKC
jgi:hypothetical protein